MTKNIEELAKIGEQAMIRQLNNALNCLTVILYRGRDLRDRWKDKFKEYVQDYNEIKEKAIKLGINISDYDEEFSGINKRYLELTKAGDKK